MIHRIIFIGFSWLLLHFSNNCKGSKIAIWMRICSTIRISIELCRRFGILQMESASPAQIFIFCSELANSSRFSHNSPLAHFFCLRSWDRIYLFWVYPNAVLILHNEQVQKLIFILCRHNFYRGSWKKDTIFWFLFLVYSPSKQ